MSYSDNIDIEVEQLKIKKLIKKVDAMKGNGTSMITLIIPENSQLSLFKDMLTTEYGTASNIKSRVNRLSVLSAITSTQHILKQYNKTPTNGLVIFCGTCSLEDGKEKKISIHFEPFKPLTAKKYVCDSSFHTEDLHKIMRDEKSYGFIILDGNGCLFGTLSGDNKNVLHKFSVDLPKKHGRGGQSALRFARLRLEARAAYLKKITELAVKMYITNDVPNVAGIILAGSAGFKNDLADTKILDHRLKKIIVNVVDISYGMENGFSEAIGKCSDILGNLKLVEERKLLTEYFDNIARDTGKVCYSYKETMYALENGAIETLIIWEEYAKLRNVYYNNEKEIEEIKIEDTNKVDENLTLIKSDTLLDWLMENYKNYGAKLKIISDKTSQGAQFIGMGQIGAILRYPLDFSGLYEDIDIEEIDNNSNDNNDYLDDLEDFL